jgi:hypothetical protein
MKHRLPSLLSVLLIAPLLLVACDGEAGPLDPSPAVGAYTLHRINGVAPPVIIGQDTRGQIQVLGGSLTLRRDGSYTETGDARILPPSGSPAPPVTSTVTGSFELIMQRGAQRVKLLTREGNLLYGTLAGDTITYAASGFTLSYVR